MSTPKRGDRATKNGIVCYVERVENGEVRGQRWLQQCITINDMERSAKLPPLARLFARPKGAYVGDFCISLIDWQLAVGDAAYERAA